MKKYRVGRMGAALASLVLAMAVAGCLESPMGALQVGAQAPVVRTVTLEDVGNDMSRITTYRYPDERMYQYSLDEALELGRPIVLTFATPAHCTVCDKQLQLLKDMVDKYEDEGVIFLHLDQYQNPGAFIAFKVRGEPWTFVIDEAGKVAFKRPGRMLYGEFDHTIGQFVGSGKG